MTDQKKTQKPQRVTTPAPELPQETPTEGAPKPEPITVDGKVFVDPLARIALAVERIAVAQAQIRDIHAARMSREMQQEQDEEVARLTAGHLEGSTVEPMRD